MSNRPVSSLAATTLAASLLIAQVWAGQCPVLMEHIDADLADTQLPDDIVAEARALREQGERLHKAGAHEESVAALQKALDLIDSD